MSYLIKSESRTSSAQTELLSMLKTRRVAGSKTEKRFIREYIDSLPNVEIDGFGNRHVLVGGTQAPPILWTSHTDSVHSFAGIQEIIVDGDHVRLAPSEMISSCLGADDATGVWLMRQMIKRGIKGRYIFHRLEESGGQGSDYIARSEQHRLDGVQIAIALDRKGYDSVITAQGHICASDTFAASIAAQLGGTYAADPTGLFTDTANYTRLIPECSNLSVGYSGAHSRDEAQDIRFACELLERLCDLDSSRLVIERDHTAPDPVDYWSHYWRGANDDWRNDQFDSPSYNGGSNYEELLSLVLSQPELIADYLDNYGITVGDLYRH